MLLLKTQNNIVLNYFFIFKYSSKNVLKKYGYLFECKTFFVCLINPYLSYKILYNVMRIQYNILHIIRYNKTYRYRYYLIY